MNITNSYVRAIRGPILLITLGLLMLADHAGSYSFWRTWPVLLVVLGIMTLLERVFSRRTTYPPAGGDLR